ncbi:hypothetical protein [Microbacterium maritypicum]
MFFFRHLINRRGFHVDSRFSIIGWRHWVAALVTVAWWGALLWLAGLAMIYTNLATIALGQIAQRAQLTRAQENHESVIALVVIMVLAVLAAMITLADIALRFCVETCLWVASSAWRFAAVRRLSARITAFVERNVLRRSPEWEIDMVYPAPRRRAVLAPSELAQQIGRERA